MSETQKDNYRELIAQKTEKLVAGLYLVTDLIESSDPIRNKLRQTGLSLVSLTAQASGDDIKNTSLLFKKSLNETKQIMSLLSIAKLASSVSEMNGTLLMGGFMTLAHVFEKRKLFLPEVFITKNEEEEMSGVQSNDSLRTYQDSFQLGFSQRELIGSVQSAVSKKGEKIHIQNEDDLIKETKKEIVTIGTSPFFGYKETERKTTHGVFKARKLSRREQILTLFIKGVDLSIKDVSSKIKGCSEKTIQRELNALVFDHIIERIGEKRWSRYILR